MKQSTSEQCFVSTTVYDEVEIQVSEILLDLHNLIRKSESRSRYRFGFTPLPWGSVRKRSNRGSTLVTSRVNYSPSLSSSLSSSPAPAWLRDGGIEPEKIKVEKIEEATSPDTPLSFFPCESDDKRMKFHSSRKNISKTKRRDALIDTVETLTKRNEMLKVEVENVRNYYNQQKTYNLKLKAMKEGVMSILNGSKPMISLVGQQQFGISTVQPIILDHHNPLRLNQYPMGQMSLGGVTTKRCPLDIPDLNMTVEDTYITERRAQFAEARRKRRLIQIKKASSLIRPHRK